MMFSMLEVMPVLLGWRFHSSICWHTSPASSYYIIGSCLVLLSVSFGAYGHLGDKLEFIENGVHSHLLWCIRCWRLCRFFSVGGFTPLFFGIPPLPLLPILSVLVWLFCLWVLELMVILVTCSSSSKTEFTRIFYDVFDVGGYAGSSQLEVSLLYLLA